MSKRKTHEEFVEELKYKNQNLDNIEFITKYINAKTHITCRCKIHNHIWDAHPWSLIQGCGCPICGQEKTHKAQTTTHEDFVERMGNINPNIEIRSRYTKNYQEVDCHCKICKHDWSPTAQNLLAGHGCPNCANIKLSNDRRNDLETLKEKSKQISKYIDICFDNYKNKNSNLDCTCKICHHKWQACFHNLMAGRGCPECNRISKGEAMISNVLNELSIDFIRNHAYDDLLSDNDVRLSYDFYLVDYNILIEYQGEQHEKPIEYFGGEEKFKIQQEHDKRKREYALKNNIYLLEIWYWDFDNIEQILKEQLHINNNKKSA